MVGEYIGVGVIGMPGDVPKFPAGVTASGAFAVLGLVVGCVPTPTPRGCGSVDGLPMARFSCCHLTANLVALRNIRLRCLRKSFALMSTGRWSVKSRRPARIGTRYFASRGGSFWSAYF